MKKASDLLNVFFDDLQKSQGEQYIDFNKSWENIIGEKIGKNSKIKDVIDGNLIIEIDHTGWKQLILAKEKQIISKINRAFPELKIKKIKFHFTDRNKTKSEDKFNFRENNTENENVQGKREEIDKDFLSLLKKMSKRSEV